MSTSEDLERAFATMRREREESLKQVVKARKNLVKAREEYEAAMLRANRAGVPNTAIAEKTGMSEAGVRMYIKRKASDV